MSYYVFYLLKFKLAKVFIIISLLFSTDNYCFEILIMKKLIYIIDLRESIIICKIMLLLCGLYINHNKYDILLLPLDIDIRNFFSLQSDGKYLWYTI